MTVVRIRKRPLPATAVQFTGLNHAEIIAWAAGMAYRAEGEQLYIITDRGDVPADPGDWIIRGLVGEFYPCTPAAYEAGWEQVGEG